MDSSPVKSGVFLGDLKRKSDALIAAGIGLEGIGLLLAERELGHDETNALLHAVSALGVLVRSTALELFSGAEQLEVANDRRP